MSKHGQTATVDEGAAPSWMDLQRVVRAREAAAILGVSSRTLWRMGKLGIGPERIKVSSRIVGYRLGDLVRR